MTPYSPGRIGARLASRPQQAPWAPAKRRKMGGTVLQEVTSRAWEFEEPFKFSLVNTAWVLGDLVIHQFFDATAGDKTPPMYYGSKWLWGIPFLLAGRYVAEDVVKGSPLARAAVIGTTANVLMQGRYLVSGFTPEFNLTVFLIHEALLVPLSLLLVRDPRAPKY